MTNAPVRPSRSLSRSAARLAAVQALFQHDADATQVAQLLHEFHHHRLGMVIDDEAFADAHYAQVEVDFFDDVVRGTIEQLTMIDDAIEPRLSKGWSMARLERTIKAILRAGTYELLARADIPTAAIISEYVDVAKAFDADVEAGFVNGVLDAIAKDVRAKETGA
ncbi:MAG: transcription antitermination factor NusB [Sphingopyxis sp.]